MSAPIVQIPAKKTVFKMPTPDFSKSRKKLGFEKSQILEQLIAAARGWEGKRFSAVSGRHSQTTEFRRSKELGKTVRTPSVQALFEPNSTSVIPICNAH